MWYWYQEQQKQDIMVKTCTIVHMCIDVMVVNMVMIFLELFATETREKRFTKASFVVIGPNWYILVIPNPSFD